MKAYAYCVLAGVFLGAALCWWLRPPVTITERGKETVVEKLVYRTNTKIVGGPGSKTTVYPDGHYVIDGEVKAESNTEGAKQVYAERIVERVVKESRVWRGLGMVGVTTKVRLDWPPEVSWHAALGWNLGHVALFDVGIALTLDGLPGLWVPDRVGLALVGTM